MTVSCTFDSVIPMAAVIPLRHASDPYAKAYNPEDYKVDPTWRPHILLEAMGSGTANTIQRLLKRITDIKFKVEEICFIMQESVGDPVAQIDSCEKLVKMAKNPWFLETKHEAFRQFKAPQLLLHILEKHEDLGSLVVATQALCEMSKVEETCEVIRLAGGLPLVEKVMKMQTGVEFIEEEGKMLVTNINGIGAKVALIEISNYYVKGELEPILKITREHVEKPAVAEQGLDAVWKIMRKDSKRIGELETLHFVDILEKIFEIHDKSEAVLHKSLGLVATMSKHENLCRDAGKRGGIITAIFAINEYVTNKNLQQTAIWALSGLIRSDKNLIAFHHHGGRKAIETARMSHKGMLIPLRLKRVLNKRDPPSTEKKVEE